jgi:hypothetical protein
MRSILLSFVFCFALVSASECWTPKTYQLIVVKSVELMPVSFKNIMLQHQEEILSGAIRPDDQGEQAHRYNVATKSGFLRDRMEDLMNTLPKKIHDHTSFRLLAADFGRLAHYMADLNDPLVLSDADNREAQYRADFAIYAEKNVDKFPWIFDGHVDPLLEKSDFEDYFYAIAFHTEERYPRIGEAYFPNGVLISSDTFDYRSHPFGIASLSYSHSISNTVQVWFYIWRKAHGDTTYTPFYRKKNLPQRTQSSQRRQQ